MDHDPTFEGLRADWRAVLDWYCVNETGADWLARAGDRAGPLVAALLVHAGPLYDAADDKRPGTERPAPAPPGA